MGDSESGSSALDAARIVVQELGRKLPTEVAACIASELHLLATAPQPTKLSYRQVAKAQESGSAPAWAEKFVHAGVAEELLAEDTLESSLCTHCQGASGLLLPLDPYINPRHHDFLAAMERRLRGGGRRRRGRMGDVWLQGLQMAKHSVIFFGLVRCMAALMRTGKA